MTQPHGYHTLNPADELERHTGKGLYLFFDRWRADVEAGRVRLLTPQDYSFVVAVRAEEGQLSLLAGESGPETTFPATHTEGA